MREIDAQRGMESLMNLLASVWGLSSEDYSGGIRPPTGRGLRSQSDNAVLTLKPYSCPGGTNRPLLRFSACCNSLFEIRTWNSVIFLTFHYHSFDALFSNKVVIGGAPEVLFGGHAWRFSTAKVSMMKRFWRVHFKRKSHEIIGAYTEMHGFKKLLPRILKIKTFYFQNFEILTIIIWQCTKVAVLKVSKNCWKLSQILYHSMDIQNLKLISWSLFDL